MANPNLLALTSIKNDTAILEVTTSAADLIAAVATNHAFLVEAIFAANIHATVVGWISVIHKRSGTDHYITYQQRIPLKTTINVLLGKSLYLFEGDSLRVLANASSNVTAEAPYSDMS